MSPEFTAEPAMSQSQSQCAEHEASTVQQQRTVEIDRLDKILNVLENLPNIHRIEHKLDIIAEDVSRLHDLLGPKASKAKKPDRTAWDAPKTKE
jgi:hypothetical protein